MTGGYGEKYGDSFYAGDLYHGHRSGFFEYAGGVHQNVGDSSGIGHGGDGCPDESFFQEMKGDMLVLIRVAI